MSIFLGGFLLSSLHCQIFFCFFVWYLDPVQFRHGHPRFFKGGLGLRGSRVMWHVGDACRRYVLLARPPLTKIQDRNDSPIWVNKTQQHTHAKVRMVLMSFQTFWNNICVNLSGVCLVVKFHELSQDALAEMHDTILALPKRGKQVLGSCAASSVTRDLASAWGVLGDRSIKPTWQGPISFGPSIYHSLSPCSDSKVGNR